MLTLYKVTCGRVVHTIHASSACDAIARVLDLCGPMARISAKTDVLTPADEPQQVFQKRLHLVLLVFAVIPAAPAIALVSGCDHLMPIRNLADAAPNTCGSLTQQKVDVSRVQSSRPILFGLGGDDLGPDPIDNSIPFIATSQPQLSPKSSPETNEGRQKPNEEPVGVDEFDKRLYRHALAFLLFVVGSFFAGSIVARFTLRRSGTSAAVATARAMCFPYHVKCGRDVHLIYATSACEAVVQVLERGRHVSPISASPIKMGVAR